MSDLTKRALEQSLKNLLLQKPLHKITISDIADDCGINRMTFYYHFKDIYDLVEWSCQEDAAKALAGKKTYETWQQGFEQIFEAVLANKPFIMNVYHSVSREQVETYLYKLTYDLLEGVVEEQAAGMSVRPEDKAFIANVYKYAFVGLMLDWIKHDMKGEPKQIIDRLDRVIHGSIAAADHVNFQILEEGGVAGRAEGNALADELALVLAANGPGEGAGSQNNGLGFINALGANQLFNIAAQIHALDLIRHTLCAKLGSLRGHTGDKAGAALPFQLLAGVIFDFIGDGDLAAVLTLFYYKGGQSAAPGVQAGGKSCRARSQYYYVVYFANKKYYPSLIVDFIQSSET